MQYGEMKRGETPWASGKVELSYRGSLIQRPSPELAADLLSNNPLGCPFHPAWTVFFSSP